MAVQDVGIYPNQQGTDVGTSKRIFLTDGTITEKIRFTTQSNRWIDANVWVYAYGIQVAGEESIDGYTYIGEAGDFNIPIASFTQVSGSVADGYLWEYAFSSVTGLSALIGSLDYTTRSYDCIMLVIRVRAFWGTDINESELGVQTCWIGFIPEYVLSEIYYDKNGLTVEYTTTCAGQTYAWTRPNDRWAINNLTDNLDVVVGEQDAYGVVGSAGKLTIPKERLLYIPDYADTLTGLVRFAGSWQQVGSTLNTLDLSTVPVVNKYVTKTPTLSLAVSSAGVTVTVGQTGIGSDLDYVEVSMVGAEYDVDRAQIPLNGTHLFEYVPFDVATEWQATGYSSAAGDLAMSQPITKTAAAIERKPGAAVFKALDGTEVVIAYDLSYSSSYQPETTVVKLAGRQRRTVGFGEGGTGTWDVSGSVLLPSRYSTSGLETVYEDILRALPESGVQIMWLPEGTRKQVYVSSIDISRMTGGRGFRSVSIQAEEVA